MLSKATAQKLEEVFGRFGEKAKQKAREEPEVLVFSLLLVLEKELLDVSSMLRNIDMALFGSNLKVAREKLSQAQ
ncbi:MAG: hypothetical protein A3F47_01950 [Candidatus Staskawiczbacteria bacterium RIFCSPHIGHO2_12_FULL_38_11]|uniref:Uncharacterized protein n=1 Tax=Candidatus Staskawiczbacteria bacterium RIFCSPHIGHO2_12_FULL_38_11 TaxID=1802209 RepID=A0A1G2I4W0_9BACT|nr:MAG: hypothetical protein A3F47_01950 [Candidatus Staskawiczbacteria bacterium RIFCSPHIGHO2_12_FULL_38_11]